MTSAGRILIMPKGNYDPSVTYEMLDLVFNSGASWVAKKPNVGIEPSEANAEYWMKMCDSVDLTEVYQRIAAIENQMLSVASLNRDGCGYYNENVDELKTAGTYVVVTFNDSVTGTFPLPKGWWYTVIVSVGGTGSIIQEWILATEPNFPTRRFTRHYEGNAWSPYFESVDSKNANLASDITIQKVNNGKAVISKNHSAEGDYGTYIEDVLADGTSAKLIVSASAGKESAAGFAFNNVWQRLFGEHNVQTLINALTNAGFGGGVSSNGIQIATGSYVGSNKHGEENKNSLTFGFEPKIVILSTGSFYDGVCIWHYGNTQVQMSTAGSSGKTSQLINFEQNGNTLSWWGINGPQYQLNQGATTYSWVAIG